jgi:hypothetical protein
MRQNGTLLHKADVGTVGVLALESGERVTAEVVGLNEDGDRLSIKVISPETLPRNTHRSHRAIPLHRIVSFEPQPHLMERWPFSDPCRDRTFSLPRFALMTTIFLCMIVGSIPLFLLLASRPLPERALEGAMIFPPTSSHAPPSNRRLRAFFGVTSAL